MLSNGNIYMLQNDNWCYQMLPNGNKYYQMKSIMLTNVKKN